MKVWSAPSQVTVMELWGRTPSTASVTVAVRDVPLALRVTEGASVSTVPLKVATI